MERLQINYSSINLEKIYPIEDTFISKLVYKILENEHIDGLCMPKCSASEDNIIARYYEDDCISVAELLPMCNTAVALVKILKGIKSSLFYFKEEYNLNTENFLFTVDEIFMTSAGDIMLLPSIAKTASPKDVELAVFNSMLKLSSVSEQSIDRIKLALDSYYSIEGLKFGAFESSLDIAAESTESELYPDELPLSSIENRLKFDTYENDENTFDNEFSFPSIPEIPPIPESQFDSVLRNDVDFSSLTNMFDTNVDDTEISQEYPVTLDFLSEKLNDITWDTPQNLDINFSYKLENENLDKNFSNEAFLMNIITNETYTIYSTPFTVGRMSDNSLVLNYPQISTYHATIFLQDGEYYIQDENSSNGTYLDGEPLLQSGAYNLSNSCIISFGGAEFMFGINYY